MSFRLISGRLRPTGERTTPPATAALRREGGHPDIDPTFGLSQRLKKRERGADAANYGNAPPTPAPTLSRL